MPYISLYSDDELMCFGDDNRATQEDEMGQLYLSNIDFLKNGVPASIIATVIVATIGYLLMTAIGYVSTRSAASGPLLTRIACIDSDR